MGNTIKLLKQIPIEFFPGNLFFRKTSVLHSKSYIHKNPFPIREYI